MLMKNKYPNQLFHLAFITGEEILGKSGFNAILNYAKLQKFIGNYPPGNMELEHPSEDYTRFMASIIDVMGEKGARALLFRGGVRAFEISLEQFPALFNLNGIEPEKKAPEEMFDEFKRIYQIIVNASNSMYGDIYRLYDCDEGVTLEMSPCLYCNKIKSEKPVCFIQVGYQHGLTRWVLGQPAKVEEVECIATGDDKCKIIVHRPK